jgi:hypothetical protein
MSNRKSHTYPKPDALTETVGRLLALGIVRLRLKQDQGRREVCVVSSGETPP